MAKESSIRISRQLIYQEVTASLRRMIEEQELWGSYLAPERELAELFGVSRETIRRGLTELENAGLVARQRGQGTYVLQQRAAASAGSRILVASFGQGAQGPYPAGLLAGLTEEAGRIRAALHFANLVIPATRDVFFVRLRDRDCDGVLLLSISERQLAEDVLSVWKGPCVLLDHYFEGLPLTSVIDDSESGARQAVEHLLALGHRRIAYVDARRPEINPWRYAGYAEALRGAGIAIDPQLVTRSIHTFESGQEAGEQLLGLEDPPTAILAFDDIRAWGVWRAAERYGLQVGRDLALVGFGDSAAQAGFPEQLSSVAVDPRELGSRAVHALASLMAGVGRAGKLIKVPTRLVVRESSAGAQLPQRPEQADTPTNDERSGSGERSGSRSE